MKGVSDERIDSTHFLLQVAELRDAADYFLLPFNASTIKCQNLRGLLHELSNDGAQAQFEEFLEELILPQMVSSSRSRKNPCSSFNGPFSQSLLEKFDPFNLLRPMNRHDDSNYTLLHFYPND